MISGNLDDVFIWMFSLSYFTRNYVITKDKQTLPNLKFNTFMIKIRGLFLEIEIYV
jgi:hypothetical protein